MANSLFFVPSLGIFDFISSISPKNTLDIWIFIHLSPLIIQKDS